MRAIPELPHELWPALESIAAHAPSSLATILRRHRLLPIAANDPSFPAALRPAVQDEWERCREAEDGESRALDAHLAHAFELFAGDEVAYIKGAVFRSDLYPDRSLRAMNDIDIVVRPERFHELTRMLRRNGYRQGDYRYFHHEQRYLPFELIPRFAQPWRHTIDHEEIVRERTSSPSGIPTLAAHHAVATHALLIGSRLHVHMRKLLDHWLLTRDLNVLAQATDTAARWNARRVFHATTTMVATAFPESGAADRMRISGATLTPSERRDVETRVLAIRRPNDFNSSPLRSKLVRLALLDSDAIRTRFLATRMLGIG